MSGPSDDILIPFLMSLGDDELVLGHRDSEWCAFAPMIEEDVAFASIAQDEMGHARLYYQLAHDKGGPSPDALAFERQARDFRSAILLERPNGDWAFTVARHLVYDIYDDILTAALAESALVELRDVAVLLRREERYHLEHQTVWASHLARGGAAPRARLEGAFAKVAREAGGLTEEAPWHTPLFETGVLPIRQDEIRSRLGERLGELLRGVGLSGFDVGPATALGGRGGTHTEDLREALASLQEVWQIDTQATW